MPLYEFRCRHCQGYATLRRTFAEMDDPALSLCCGAPLDRQFSANGNIIIPIHMRQFLTGGDPGGGSLSWSDFHGDETERDLARNEFTVPANEARSMSRFGKTH